MTTCELASAYGHFIVSQILVRSLDFQGRFRTKSSIEVKVRRKDITEIGPRIALTELNLNAPVDERTDAKRPARVSDNF